MLQICLTANLSKYTKTLISSTVFLEISNKFFLRIGNHTFRYAKCFNIEIYAILFLTSESARFDKAVMIFRVLYSKIMVQS